MAPHSRKLKEADQTDANSYISRAIYRYLHEYMVQRQFKQRELDSDGNISNSNQHNDAGEQCYSRWFDRGTSITRNGRVPAKSATCWSGTAGRYLSWMVLDIHFAGGYSARGRWLARISSKSGWGGVDGVNGCESARVKGSSTNPGSWSIGRKGEWKIE